MTDQFSNTQRIRKLPVISKGGIVAAQSRKAAEVARGAGGRGELRDAVIATRSRRGAGALDDGDRRRGAMVLYRAREDRYEVIDYGMPRAQLRPP